MLADFDGESGRKGRSVERVRDGRIILERMV